MYTLIKTLSFALSLFFVTSLSGAIYPKTSSSYWTEANKDIVVTVFYNDNGTPEDTSDDYPIGSGIIFADKKPRNISDEVAKTFDLLKALMESEMKQQLQTNYTEFIKDPVASLQAIRAVAVMMKSIEDMLD